jgi:branched-chain amino acid aminotransferase
MSESINRAFFYGESVFTTMRLINGHISDWEYHFDRLKRGAEFLYGPFNDGEDWAMVLRGRLEDRAFLEGGDKVIRLTIYREQARGLLRTGITSVNDLKIHVNSSPYDPNRSEGKMLKLRTCSHSKRPHWWPSYLKAGSYLETILAQKMFMKPGDDDVLFLSPQDTVWESSVANIFVVRHNKLYTAPTGPNVLDGIMRRKVIESYGYFFDAFEESETSFEQLFKADAIFGTNSIRGPFLIDRIDDHDFIYDQEMLNKFELMRKRVFG